MIPSHRRGRGARRGRAEEGGLLELKLVHLLVAVHLDDEGDDEHEEGGAGDPGGAAGAPKELLGDEGRVGGGLLGVVHDGGVGDGGGSTGEDAFAVAGGGAPDAGESHGK